MSTASGIPDFRGPDGVWTKIDPAEFTLDRYMASADTRRRSWAMRKASTVLDAQPNAAHAAIVELWQRDRLEACVTQNIDGLHGAAGLPPESVVELHGNAHSCRCLDCDMTWTTSEIIQRVEEGDDDPHCEACGGIIKAAVISFGEQMPFDAMDRAYEAAARCDGVVSAGSTLGVYPAADVPMQAAARGVPYIVINRGETMHDAIADVLIDGDVTEILPELVGRV